MHDRIRIEAIMPSLHALLESSDQQTKRHRKLCFLVRGKLEISFVTKRV